MSPKTWLAAFARPGSMWAIRGKRKAPPRRRGFSELNHVGGLLETGDQQKYLLQPTMPQLNVPSMAATVKATKPNTTTRIPQPSTLLDCRLAKIRFAIMCLPALVFFLLGIFIAFYG